MSKSKLTPPEMRRYQRQILLDDIGLEGQLKIKLAKVLVIGSGGLGSSVLQYLTAAGIGHIGIIDFDVIDESNIHRQVLYSQNDIGKLKTIVAEKKLKALNPFVSVNIHNMPFKQNIQSLSIVNDYDLVIDCTDNFETRYLINDACVLSNKPMVYGAIFKHIGQISVFNLNGGPTYRCLFPEMDQDKRLTDSRNFGVLGTLPGIVGCIQANEVIKVILGSKFVLNGKLFVINLASMETFITSVMRKPDAVNVNPWI